MNSVIPLSQYDMSKTLDVICTDVNMVRKRARRTPKPIITEAKPGRRCEHDDDPAGVDALGHAFADAVEDGDILRKVSLFEICI